MTGRKRGLFVNEFGFRDGGLRGRFLNTFRVRSRSRLAARKNYGKYDCGNDPAFCRIGDWALKSVK
jgi:hypothetical protein